MAGVAGESKMAPRLGPECATATDTAPPQVALLSNGRYGVVITAAGSGCSTWRGLDVTPLAGGCDARLLGSILLHPGPDRGHGLVRRVPAIVPGSR